MTSNCTPSYDSDGSSAGPVAHCLDIERGIEMMGSDASLRRLLGTVAANLASHIPEIQRALEGDDVLTANRLLHAIKGYAPIFCTDALVAQVTFIEGQSKTETASVVKPLFVALAPQFERLLQEIHAYLGAG